MKLNKTNFHLQIKKGLDADINATATKNLAVEGEPHWTTDTNQLYIFDGTQNIRVPTLDSNGDLSERIGFIDVGLFSDGNEPTASEGRLFFSQEQNLLSYYDSNNVEVNIGSDIVLKAKNKQGSTINKGDVVYVSGSSGENPEIKLAKADSLSTARIIGLVLKDSINNNAVGKVITFGRIVGIDTSSFTDGQTVYLSETTAGELTATKPSSPDKAFRVGTVIRSDANNGSILVDTDREINNLTQGSVIFVGSDGDLEQDNSNFYWDNNNNRLGVNNNSPSAKVEIGAGDASEAPLKLNAGTNLSTPQSGALEFDGSALEFTPASDRRSINLANGVILSDTNISNTTTETTIFSEPVSAHELYKGSKWHTRASGHYSTANASDTFTMRMKIGGTTIHTFTSTAENVTDGFFRIEWFFTVRSTGATGTVQSSVDGQFNNDSKNEAKTSTDTIDTTAAEDLTLTVQWSAADASNTLTITQGHTDIFGVSQS